MASIARTVRRVALTTIISVVGIGLTANIETHHARAAVLPQHPHACQAGYTTYTYNNSVVYYGDTSPQETAVINYKITTFINYGCQQGVYEVAAQQVSGNVYDDYGAGADATAFSGPNNAVFDQAGTDCDGLPHASSGQWSVHYFSQNPTPYYPWHVTGFFNDQPNCSGHRGVGPGADF